MTLIFHKMSWSCSCIRKKVNFIKIHGEVLRTQNKLCEKVNKASEARSKQVTRCCEAKPVEVFYLNVRQSLCYTAGESIFCYLPAILPTAVTEEHSESIHQAGNRNFCSLAADATLPLHSSQVSGRAGASNAAIWGFKSAPIGGLLASGWVLVAELDRWRMRYDVERDRERR